MLLQRNVSVILSPPPCEGSERLLLMISSGPNNIESRGRWREAISGVGGGEGEGGLKVMFLVSSCQPGQDCPHQLEEEHRHHGDILQTSLLDGHRRLGYKILAGYVWAHQHCPGVGHVLKTDDNVVMDLPLLLSVSRHPLADGSITCGAGTPHRNMKTLRSDRPHMTGNWSTTKEELEDDIMPDFCCGFTYITTPGVGARLVQAANLLYPESEVVQIEDSLITGVLRERAGVELVSLDTSWRGWAWLRLFSHCPWLTITKLTFSNELVLSKRSSRQAVQYVGGVTEVLVWRYYLCLHLEVGLDNLNQNFPALIPAFIWDLCTRS